MSTTGVLCAVRGPAESAVVRAVGEVPHLAVTRRCADLAELLAAAAAGLGEVAVVSADLAGLDREAVSHLHGSGVWVLALPGEHRPADARLLGVDAVVAGDDADQRARAVPRAIVDVLAGAARGERPGRVVPATPAGQAPDEVRPAAVPRGPRQRGTVVAVWGPTGAPGRTTVAVNLAAELADRGRGTVLVDADTYGGTVAQMLGLLDEAPGIAAAVRAASTGRLDAATLAALTPVLPGGLRVLTGISRADRWPEVTASGLELVWAAARDLADWTVVDCGFGVERDEALSYDTRAPHRNAATLSALEAADAVVVVGAGDPIGLQRLVRALADLTDLGVPVAARRVVVNRVRASASGARPGRAVRDALARYAGVTDVQLVPDDRSACDGAVLAARTLREHAPASPTRRALAGLAGSLLSAAASVEAH